MADKKEQSHLERIKEASLTASGYAYLVGDAALFASGWMGGRYKEALTGLIWTTGGLVVARYGKPDAEKQLQEIFALCRDSKRLESTPVNEFTDCFVS